MKYVKALGLGFLLGLSGSVFAAEPPQSAATSGPNPGKQAVNVRKAAFSLIGNSFKPIGETLQGKTEYNQADIVARANRIVVLNEFLDNSFPESSNLGDPDSKAKADIWSNRADFDKKLKDFKEHSATLLKVASTEKTASESFKEAASAVAKDCKGCHDSYKTK